MRAAFFVLMIMATPLLGGVAHACLNDFEVRRAEQEFRGAYPDDLPAIEADEPAGGLLLSSLGVGVGALLLALAFRAAARGPQ
ncbi:MAG: hypothetical protein H6704_23955 [Myxococcales bacterium]|nr:hypothetical protein [Myxococcales bacterium]